MVSEEKNISALVFDMLLLPLVHNKLINYTKLRQ